MWESYSYSVNSFKVIFQLEKTLSHILGLDPTLTFHDLFKAIFKSLLSRTLKFSPARVVLKDCGFDIKKGLNFLFGINVN